MLPERSKVDFVLFAPGRDYDFLAEVDVIDIEFEDDELTVQEPSPEDEVTQPLAQASGLTWWQAARMGLRATSD